MANSMNRRSFLQASVPFLAGSFCWPPLASGQEEALIIGHGDFRYKVDPNWGNLDPKKHPVKDCHEMVQDARGRIFLLGNHTQNNVLIYDTSGQIQGAWGKEYPGAHGLTLSEEGGTEYLYLTDYERHEVIKTTLDGRVVMTLGCPLASEKYRQKEAYKPTETAIAPNGDIFVADGYGEQWIIHYDARGNLKNVFGGKTHFGNAHGICLDQRLGKTPRLLISAREQNKLKEFSLEGELLGEVALPGAYICRPVIHGEEVYLATLISKTPWDSQSGFICILDKNNQLVSVPGGSRPATIDQAGQHLHQTLKVFQHPHDVCVDRDENLYVAQWNSGQTYPLKLVRV